MKNENVNFGMGAIGELQNAMTQNEFLEYVINKLKAKNLRFAKGKKGKIKKVAVCGGSGADMLSVAISQNADAVCNSRCKVSCFPRCRK
ncbi:MAG: Nif3-like dinuclear metal center hexameric protein [Melioribacteraceae bacterium]|nr:Nif3-like dinuclear metal center hexameric protein [Melioribacteraceae bacterium]